MRISTWKLVLALVLAALGLQACGQSVTSGTVMSRDGRSSHWNTWVSYGSRCVLSMTTRTRVRTGSNSYTYVSSSRCVRSTVVMIPHHAFIPAWWQLCLRSDDGKTTGCIDVSELRWLAFPVGSHYPDGGAR